MKVHEDIETHIESHFGISQGFELVKFLGGANREGDYTSAQAIKQAQNNLHKFKIVGFLEHLEEFIEKFHASFNVKLHIDQKNQNPAPLSYQKSVLTPELIEQITEQMGLKMVETAERTCLILSFTKYLLRQWQS